MDLVWWVSRYILGIYALLLVSSLILVFLFRFHYSRNLQERSQRRHRVLGFYHPYCSGGGGGERVLWKMIQVIGDLVEKGSSLQVVIYTIDAPSPSYEQDVLDKVQERFDLTISSQIRLKFVHLDKYKHWLEPSPRFSMLVESYGTVRLACAGLQQELPDWWIDTTGAAFTFLPAWALGCQIAAYVHYPTISTDMLGVVWKQPGWKAKVKLIYYRLFAALYGLTGFLANCVMVNSTWTANHIRSIWFCSPRIVYPPCRELIPAKLDKKEPFILSIGQFRPEKDHKVQLEAMKLLLQEHPEYRQSAKLVVLGSCRNEADQSRLEDLRCLAKTLAIDDCVQFVVNEPYSVLQEWLLKSKVGIHTMWNEHFGIGIVEMMAAGLIVVAHRSGGPQSDIIHPGKTGFLASNASEYASKLHRALTTKDDAIAKAAQTSSQRFCDEVFAKSWRDVLIDYKMI